MARSPGETIHYGQEAFTRIDVRVIRIGPLTLYHAHTDAKLGCPVGITQTALPPSRQGTADARVLARRLGDQLKCLIREFQGPRIEIDAYARIPSRADDLA
jgi:hypothetical protein